MSTQTRAYKVLLQAIAEDFLLFCEKCFQTLHPGVEFHRAEYQKAIAWELKRCEQGADQNLLVVNIAPRHLKSEMISVFFSAWILGHDPTATIISISYGADLVVKLSNNVRTIMNTQWYKDTFPQTRISPKKNTETDFETTAGGRRYATTVNSELTGHGAKYILIDDPHNISQLPSQASLKSDMEWLKGGVWSRFEGHTNGAFIVIMQRYHPHDMTGYLVQEMGFRQLRLEAIAKQDSDVEIGPNQFWHRKKGDVLNPGWINLEALQKTKQVMGEPAFEAQYQQDPTFGMGCLYKSDDFPHYSHIRPRHQYTYVVAAVDPASSIQEESSFSACVVAGIVDNEIHILRAWHEKAEYARVLAVSKKIIDLYGPSHFIVENTSVGPALISDLRVLFQGIAWSNPKTDKLMQALSHSNIINAKRVHLPNVNYKWLKPFKDELFGFPGAPFDDQVDAFNLILKAVQKGLNGVTKVKYKKQPGLSAYPGPKIAFSLSS